MTTLLREQRIVDNNKRALIKYVFVSDGTPVANATLLDVSSLAYSLNTNGRIMTGNTDIKSNYRTTIRRIFGQAKANAYYSLQWEGDSNSEIITFSTGFDFAFQSMGDGAVISNPEANATGDILYSVPTPNAGDTFTIFVELRKDARDYDAGQTADPVSFNQGAAAFR